jgi:hypothetical protein
MRKLLLAASTLVAFAFTLNAQPPGGRDVHVTLHEGTRRREFSLPGVPS